MNKVMGFGAAGSKNDELPRKMRDGCWKLDGRDKAAICFAGPGSL